jgi:hypothetical protein
LDNKIYASATPYYEKEESFLLQEIDLHTGKRIASYLRTSDYNQGWNEWTNYFANNEGFFYPDNKEGAKYVQMFMDTVISIGSHGIRPYFAVKSKNWISKKDVRDLLESKKSNNGLTDDRILFDRNIAYGIHQIYEFGKLIYFRVYKGGTGINVFYNTETNTTEIKDFIIDDLVFRKGGQSVLLPRLSFVDDKGVYSYFQDGMIHSLYEIAQSDGLNPNLDKRDSLVKLAEDANPVIFYYQFRESH